MHGRSGIFTFRETRPGIPDGKFQDMSGNRTALPGPKSGGMDRPDSTAYRFFPTETENPRTGKPIRGFALSRRTHRRRTAPRRSAGGSD